ncbi:MAG TPA: cytochrome c biogenesis heme-transporting ATPase CcmA [Casimicrobiaceae bacterium]|nr:cytochrome c biogenesis heme-transporting ATPase CcmA [Casimicrobiaceae bacterium]
MPASVTLAAQDLAARRGTRLLWQGVNLTLSAGDALVVRGANGVGKTTLLRVLAGLAHAEHGSVRWRGAIVAPHAQALRDDVLFIGHAPALRDELTAAENLTSLAALAAEPMTAGACSDALAAVDLAAQASLPARVLSEGQRRRVPLARLASTSRPLWILDEPAAALDAAGVRWLGARLAGHLAQDGVAVVSTHAPIDVPGARVAEMTL